MINVDTSVLIRNSIAPEKQGWLALPCTEEELESFMKSIGVTYGEEIGDTYEMLMNGDPIPGYEIIEYDSNYVGAHERLELEEANELLRQVEDMDSYDEELLLALIAYGETLENAIQGIDNGAQFYPCRNLSELAEEFAKDEVFDKDYLLEYVDWERVGHDLECSGYTEVNDGVLYIA